MKLSNYVKPSKIKQEDNYRVFRFFQSITSQPYYHPEIQRIPKINSEGEAASYTFELFIKEQDNLLSYTSLKTADDEIYGIGVIRQTNSPDNAKSGIVELFISPYTSHSLIQDNLREVKNRGRILLREILKLARENKYNSAIYQAPYFADGYNHIDTKLIKEFGFKETSRTNHDDEFQLATEIVKVERSILTLNL